MQCETPLDDEKQHDPHATEEGKQPSANKTEDTTRRSDAELEVPLSAFEGGETLVPVSDMADWVQRPKHVREQEKTERQGYVPRPLNAFMLYRRANLERAKVWCDQNMPSCKPNKQQSSHTSLGGVGLWKCRRHARCTQNMQGLSTTDQEKEEKLEAARR
jgi:hypothetical protein